MKLFSKIMPGVTYTTTTYTTRKVKGFNVFMSVLCFVFAAVSAHYMFWGPRNINTNVVCRRAYDFFDMSGCITFVIAFLVIFINWLNEGKEDCCAKFIKVLTHLCFLALLLVNWAAIKLACKYPNKQHLPLKIAQNFTVQWADILGRLWQCHADRNLCYRNTQPCKK